MWSATRACPSSRHPFLSTLLIIELEVFVCPEREFCRNQLPYRSKMHPHVGVPRGRWRRIREFEKVSGTDFLNNIH